MLKKKHIYIGVTLIISVFAIVSGYRIRKTRIAGEKHIADINRNLAKSIKTMPRPALQPVTKRIKLQGPTTGGDSQPTLTQEKLQTLRRTFSRTNTPLTAPDLLKEKTIVLANRTITVPDKPEMPERFSQNQSLTQRSTLPYIIHFGRPVTPQMRSNLENAGAIIRGYLPNYAFLAELTEPALAELSSNPEINYVAEYAVDDKIQPFLAALNKTEEPDETLLISIQTLAAEDVTLVEEFVKKHGGSIENTSRLSQWGVVEAVISLSDAALLAKMGEVQWIEERVPLKLLNDYAAKSDHLNADSAWNDWYLTGSGQIVGHADTGLDTGDPATLHPDFQGQIAAIFDRANGGSEAADYFGHGTHTAGSICGNGFASSGQYKGIAHEAKLVSQCVADNYSGYLTGLADLFGMYQQSYDAGASIHSDSWGADVDGYYNTDSRITDLFAWTYPDFLAVFAAGNAGVDYDYNGIVDQDSLDAPGSAKNVLTVGATENDRPYAMEGLLYRTYGSAWPSDYSTNPIKDDYISRSATTSPYMQGMAAFSSRGPTDDNRAKPDICAPGTDVISVKSTVDGTSSGWGLLPSNNNYCYNGGTSMATPLAAGSLALLRQYMVERAGIPHPSSALLKATIIGGSRSLAPGQYGTGSTQEIPNTTPNNVEGWGQPDIEQAVHPEGMMIKLLDNISPVTGETNTFEVTIEKTGYPLDIVLCWVDYPATAGAAVTLINDLNLNVITPEANTLFPNSGTADDDRNTVESVSISSATTGVYKINVIGFNIPQSGGVAALYLRGAFDEKPVIVHKPTPFYNYELAPYLVPFKVQYINVLTNNELTLFYNTGTESSVTGGWQTAAVEWTSNVNYEAFIPQFTENTILHYYFQCTNGIESTELPLNAVESNNFFTVHLGAPVTLVVDGNPDKHGTVSPDYGTNSLLSGETFTAAAYPETVSSTERLAAYDWNGTGDIPVSGSENPFTAALSRNSTLTWNWQTQYKLTRTIYVLDFSATFDDGSNWYWKDMTLPDQSTPDVINVYDGYNEYLNAFYGWSLNGNRWPDATSPSPNPLSNLVMTGAFTLRANYMDFFTDSDGDSLYDWWEMKYYGKITGTDSAGADTDGDLWTSLGESLDNTDPFDPSSVPTPPVVTVNPLNPFQTARPPWTVTADVTDNFMITYVILEWKEKNDTVWQQTEMDYLDENTYTAILDPPSHGSIRVDYRVIAYDVVGYYDPTFGTVSPQYSVIGDYDTPWIDLTPASLGTAELTTESTNFSLTVSNLAGPNLMWTGVLVTASQSFDADDPSWQHSGDNDVWNISTYRTWNGDPVWYCGDNSSHLYPNGCNASLDTPEFTVGKHGLLVFRHWMDFEEYGYDMPDYYWDGAIVMISTDGGANFSTLEPIGGYNAYIVPNTDSPFPEDMPCFGDTGSGWKTVMVDLTEFAGSSAIIRFQFGSDLYVTYEGWYVANVTVLSAEAPQPAWLTKTGSWNGVLPDMWSENFAFTVDPLLMARNSENIVCVRMDSNDPESNPASVLTIRRGFAVSGQTTGSGTITVNDPFIFRDETAVVDIQADFGSYITNITINGELQPGDYGYKDTHRNYTLQPVTNDMHYTADFKLRSWDLVINSPHGNPSPAEGYYYIPHGTTISAAVTTPETDADPMVRYSADGFTLDGADPVSEISGEVSFILTNHTTLTWQWTTNYQMNAYSTGNGLVFPQSAWYSAGSTGSTTGYPANFYHFSRWGGDTNGAGFNVSIINLPMNAPRTISASFEPNITPSHGVPEYWLSSYGFSGNFETAAEADQDGDKVPTWKEWYADTDPTDVNSLLQMSSIIIDPLYTHIIWTGGNTRTQMLQSASTPTGPWIGIYTNIPPTTVTNTIQLQNTGDGRFFRVVVP